MEPRHKVVTPRKEVREGRAFDPSEFAIALEQVVRGEGPVDYRDPVKFISRTSFTRALREHTRLVLRRLSGETTDSAPVMTLITQFGGGKTHTLTLLYHLVKHASRLADEFGVAELLRHAGVKVLPKAKVAVFVGGAWDPQEGRETPWIDLARQLAGDAGVALLGRDAKHAPPGTEAIARVMAAAGGSVLFLFDEVLNCLNRHRSLAEPFHAFVQNLTVAAAGSERSAALISLPRSQVEMTAWAQEWQDRIARVVRRVAKDLADGTLPHEFDRNERTEVATQVREADEAAQDEAWASYRYVVIPDREQSDGVQVIDLAAGHAGTNESLTARILAALRMESALNDSVGASYIERRWPPPLTESGAWPLSSLRQAFLSGALTRLVDVDGTLKAKIPEFVAAGMFGLASGARPDGSVVHVWFPTDRVDPDDVVFESDIFLLKKQRAIAVRTAASDPPGVAAPPPPLPDGVGDGAPRSPVLPGGADLPERDGRSEGVDSGSVTVVIAGDVPPDVWNRVGTRLIPKVRDATSLHIGLNIEVTMARADADALMADLRRVLVDLGLDERVRVDLQVPESLEGRHS